MMRPTLGSLRRTTRNLSTSSWTFATTSKLVCEPGGTSRLGEILQSLGGSRVMLVTDGGVYGAGLCDAAIDSLDAAGLFTVLHGETVADPPESLVLEAAALARDEKVDAVVGLGGGSSMDVANDWMKPIDVFAWADEAAAKQQGGSKVTEAFRVSI